MPKMTMREIVCPAALVLQQSAARTSDAEDTDGPAHGDPSSAMRNLNPLERRTAWYLQQPAFKIPSETGTPAPSCRRKSRNFRLCFRLPAMIHRQAPASPPISRRLPRTAVTVLHALLR